MSISKFKMIWLGEPVEIYISLCKNGYYGGNNGNRQPNAISFDYPPLDDEVSIGFVEFEEFGEELGLEIRSALEQQLNLNSAS